MKESRSLSWSPGWRPATTVFCLSLLVIGLAFWETYRDIVIIWWRSETFAHGFLILPIVGYLVWLKRATLAPLTPQPAPVALLMLLGMVCIWVLGYAAEVMAAKQLAAVMIVPALTWAIFGTRVARSIIFPLAYLFFAVPIGDFLVPPLQDLTAAFSVWALQLTGIPVYWEGLFFHIPSGSFEVAQACSGIRYLIASLALGTLYAYLNFTTPWRRWVFVALSAVIPLVANGVRAYGIVMIAHLSDYKLAVGVDHLIYGWLFFGVVILLLFWVGSRFQETPREDSETTPPPAVGGQAVSAQVFVLWAVIATGVTIAAPGFAAWMDTQRETASVWEPVLPVGRGGWQGPSRNDELHWPNYVGAVERRGEYHKQGRRVQVYLAYYPVQVQDAELINWQNRVYDPKYMRRLGDGDELAYLPDGRQWAVHETRIGNARESRLVWLWYEVEGTTSINHLQVKAYEAWGRLRGSNRGSAAWVLSTDYEMTPAQGRDVLEAFLADMLPALRASLKP